MPEIVKRSSAWRKREDTGARLVHAVDFENKIVDQNKIAARQNGGGAESPDGSSDGDCFGYATARK
jgi:uncharacterized protein with PIN domain